MSRSSLRIAFGLILAVAVAWGMSPDPRAAAGAAANAGASAVTWGGTIASTVASAALPGTPAGEPEPIPSRSLAGAITDDAAANDAPQGNGKQGKGQAKPKGKPTQEDFYAKFQKVSPAEQKAAAKRSAEMGMLPGAAGLELAAASITPADLPVLEGPGGVPHYFGPYGNWAYSPLPSFPILSVSVDAGGSGYSAPEVFIKDVYGTGSDSADAPLMGTATVTDGVITEIAIPEGGKGFHVPFVEIIDPTGTGAEATAVLNLERPSGGIRKFVDRLPGLGPTGANNIIQAHGLGQYLPVAAKEEWCSRPEAIA
ncbi:MAG TPA: hypothetical protein PKK95_02545, partial [Vicinamibacterales bacterium]|nr:hypothetical protein [Vicinamibacterales bacterium]